LITLASSGEWSWDRHRHEELARYRRSATFSRRSRQEATESEGVTRLSQWLVGVAITESVSYRALGRLRSVVRLSKTASGLRAMPSGKSGPEESSAVRSGRRAKFERSSIPKKLARRDFGSIQLLLAALDAVAIPLSEPRAIRQKRRALSVRESEAWNPSIRRATAPSGQIRRSARCRAEKHGERVERRVANLLKGPRTSYSISCLLTSSTASAPHTSSSAPASGSRHAGGGEVHPVMAAVFRLRFASLEINERPQQAAPV